MAEGNIPQPDDGIIVRTGIVSTILDNNTDIKQANIPSITGYSILGGVFMQNGDGFNQEYTFFIMGITMYIRNPANNFTPSTQFSLRYIAVYKKN